MTARFADKAAIVTGGAGGIGLATAARLASEGCRVQIADLDVEASETAAAGLRRAGAPDAAGVACDVSSEEQVEAAVAAALQRFGRLDIIVNNAGMMLFKGLADLTATEWRRVLDVDLFGAVHFTRQAFRVMAAGGAIVNVSSVHAEQTSPLVAPYAAAKAALLSLTRSAAIEGRAKGLRVNAVPPGAIDTPMLWDNLNVKSGAEKIDASQVGRPEQVAAAIAFLASDEAAFVTGVALRVDGGRLIEL
jgi:NAD(P)-dependent dehydrogenase (short-subunit alcohol dehydrogenase family)